MLEAFLHDPLISWNLDAGGGGDGGGGGAATSRASADGASAVRASAEAARGQHASAQLEPLRIGTEEDAVDAGSLPESGRGGRRPPRAASVASAPAGGEGEAQDERSRGLQALSVVQRVQAKLYGTDFDDPAETGSTPPLDTPTQVSRLIAEAQSHANLCLMYQGWNPSW